MRELSRDEARRLALASLGFGAKRPARAGAAHVRATAARLGAIQIDSVNVLARAHYLPTFSRHGGYPMTALDDLAHGRRELFEYWGHAACFLPIDLYPLMRWRMHGQFEGWSSVEPETAGVHGGRLPRDRRARPARRRRDLDRGQEHGPVVGLVEGKPARRCSSARDASPSRDAATSNGCTTYPSAFPA